MPAPPPEHAEVLDCVDRAIVMATQGGLPLVPQPYHAVGDKIGVSGEEVMTRLVRMLESGAVRRIGAVPNHYALGYTANGMAVWDVDDADVGRLGHVVGALPFVTHCYERVRHPPLWPYNLFAMVHGRTRGEVEERVSYIAAILGAASRASAVLYSTRILKKTGLRLKEQ
jgi:DNA-binding Lrp family transcriptional regulator